MATVPRLQRYYQGAKTTCIPSLRLIDSPAGTTYIACLVVVRSRAPGDRRPVTGPGLCTGALQPYSQGGECRFSQVSWQSIPWLCAAPATPDGPAVPRHCGTGGVVPSLVTLKTPSDNRFRGSITPLHHPLCTLHDVRYHTPCNTRFRPVGCTFTGLELNLLNCNKWFHYVIVASTSGLCLAQYQFGSRMMNVIEQPSSWLAVVIIPLALSTTSADELISPLQISIITG